MKITNRKENEPLNEWIERIADGDDNLKDFLTQISKESYIEGVHGTPELRCLDLVEEYADNGFILEDKEANTKYVYNTDDDEENKEAKELGSWVLGEIAQVISNKVRIRVFVEPINE